MQIRGESAAILRPGSKRVSRGWGGPAAESPPVRPAGEGGREEEQREEEHTLLRWMVGTIVMMVMMLPSTA